MTEYDWTPFEEDKWAPKEVGDVIKGRVKSIRTEDGLRGALPVLTLATSDGDREVWPSSYLVREFARITPQVGDGLRIELTELRHTGQPQPMKVYSIGHKPAAEFEDSMKPEPVRAPDDYNEEPF